MRNAGCGVVVGKRELARVFFGGHEGLALSLLPRAEKALVCGWRWGYSACESCCCSAVRGAHTCLSSGPCAQYTPMRGKPQPGLQASLVR